jgi:hypothetical protein
VRRAAVDEQLRVEGVDRVPATVDKGEAETVEERREAVLSSGTNASTASRHVSVRAQSTRSETALRPMPRGRARATSQRRIARRLPDERQVAQSPGRSATNPLANGGAG